MFSPLRMQRRSSVFLFVSCVQHTGQIKGQGQKQVQHVQNDGGLPVRKPSEQGGQEEGIALKEHVIRADGGVVDDIGGDGYKQRRNCGQDQLPRLVEMRVAVVARGLHEDKAEHHDAVEQHGVCTGKGEDRIVGEHGNGIKEVDRGTDQPQRAKVAAGCFFHIVVPPQCKRHGVNENAAGVQGQNAAPFKGNLVAAHRFPGDLDHLPYCHGRPKHRHQIAYALVICATQLNSKENDQRNQQRGDHEMQGGEQRADKSVVH